MTANVGSSKLLLSLVDLLAFGIRPIEMRPISVATTLREAFGLVQSQ
jgi:hypothetical protein